MGHGQAVDYATITGGVGAQYSTADPAMFTAIDFTADVLKAVNDTLSGTQLDYYLRLLRTAHEYTNATDDEIKAHEKAGRCFQERGLYPVVKYLTT